MIGINTAILAGATGLGFAIPINVALDVAEQILTTGRVRRAYLGIDYIEIEPMIAERFGLPVEEGLIVTQIGRNSPAARAGLRVEDFIVGFNGRPVADAGDLVGHLHETAPGTTVRLDIIRGGRRSAVNVTLGEAPAQ